MDIVNSTDVGIKKKQRRTGHDKEFQIQDTDNGKVYEAGILMSEP